MTFAFGFDTSSLMKTIVTPNLSEELANRKGAHIELAAHAQTLTPGVDSRFNYEPLFFSHPKSTDKWETKFLDFTLDYPLWVSSMTGGTVHARTINQNLARLCGKYKLGMGLGSCRSLLSGEERLEDFSLRSFIGDGPLFANLGIAQLEELVCAGKVSLVHEMVQRIEATGLIIHLNPLQEWFQPEGDRFQHPPLETMKRFLSDVSYPVVVKEVGQGMGPKSLKALLDLPIAAIELAAFGGTNFSLLENMRGGGSEMKRPFIQVGHSAKEMVGILNALPKNNKHFIISGGIRSVLDGYELLETLMAPAVIGMAQAFLAPALEGEVALEKHFLDLREALLTAKGVLQVKGDQ
jgi:isopentenyl-diphosphate delta-isomerase